jgi:hypothetical protein
VGDAAAILQTVKTLSANLAQRFELASRAQARMGPNGLSSDAYARRHVELSRELLAGGPK